MKHFLLIGGARPNFMKLAPLVRALEMYECTYKLVHTGQHYDPLLSDVFFRELGLPEPHFYLGVGSSDRITQTQAMMKGLQPILINESWDGVIVVGDVTSTVAATMAAIYVGIPVIHVEAGLRSFNWRMIEEVNRVFVDHYAKVLFTSEPQAEKNLLAENIKQESIHAVGNIMIDTLRFMQPVVDSSSILTQLASEPKQYGVVTLHRPELLNDHDQLAEVWRALEEIGKSLPLIFPLHPRTRAVLVDQGITSSVRIRFIEPLGYIDMQRLVREARCVFTDSGGLQEETTVLDVPCFTVREDTERPITVEVGTNTLVGCTYEGVLSAFKAGQQNGFKVGKTPSNWDGHTAERIVKVLTSL